MRNLLLSLVLTSFVILGLSGCKYEEGPWISLRSADNRMVNSWKFTFMQFNGANGLEGNQVGAINYKLSTMGFNDENRFSITWRRVDATQELFTGDWSFEDNNETLILDYDDMPQLRQVFSIVKLKKNDLWLEEKVGDDLYEYHLEGEE